MAEGAALGNAAFVAAERAGQLAALQAQKRAIVAEVVSKLDFKMDRISASTDLARKEDFLDVIRMFKMAKEFDFRHTIIMQFVFFLGGPIWFILPFIVIPLIEVLAIVTCCLIFTWKPAFPVPPKNGLVTLMAPFHVLFYLIFGCLFFDLRYVRLFSMARKLEEKIQNRINKPTLTCVTRDAIVQNLSSGGLLPTEELDLETLRSKRVCMVIADFDAQGSPIAVVKELVQHRKNKHFTHYVFPQSQEEQEQFHAVMMKWNSQCTIRFVKNPRLPKGEFSLPEKILGNYLKGPVSMWDTSVNDLESIESPGMLLAYLEVYLIGKYKASTAVSMDTLGVDVTGAVLLAKLLAYVV